MVMGSWKPIVIRPIDISFPHKQGIVMVSERFLELFIYKKTKVLFDNPF